MISSMRYEGQRDMIYNLYQQTVSEGLKDAQQTMTAMKAANKELKGMMKTVKHEDINAKYGDILKRFNGCVNGAHFDMNFSALRAKIATAFKFDPEVLMLTSF